MADRKILLRPCYVISRVTLNVLKTKKVRMKMARMHIHISVDNLEKSTDFYSKLFGKKPTKQKEDYAKWMLNDPRVNFAISARGAKTGLDHLGM